MEFTTGSLTCLSVNVQLLSPPMDCHFGTPHAQSMMTGKLIKGTQKSKDSHSTGISFQVSDKFLYGSPEIPTLPKEGEFMSLLRETIEMLQELRQRKPQSPVPPEHIWNMHALEPQERTRKKIPLLKYPLRVLPIHSAVLGMSTQSAAEYIFTSTLWTLISAIFPSQCTWNQSPKSLTSLSTHFQILFQQ